MTKWKEAVFLLANDIEIKVAHTIPSDEELDAAFQGWLIRNQDSVYKKETAERSFAEYIQSKGHEAMIPKPEGI
jgi:hypothetical protein